MKTTFDTDAILFDLLSKSSIKDEINGGIYVGDTRPINSKGEDIVINTIDLTQEHLPQLATSNVNIYVADTHKTIGGEKQLQANRVRLRKLTKKAMAVLRKARIPGLRLVLDSQTTLAEPRISQHFANIRVKWIIH